MSLLNALFRASHYLYKRKIILVPDLISLIIRLIYSADIHYQATIGRKIVFSHAGLGTIIHPRAVLGDRVTIGAQVVIGCNLKSFAVPRIGNNVFIGPGAKILGELTIGNNVLIGAGAVVLQSVPDNSVVAGVPAKIVRTLSQEEIYAFWPPQ